MQITKNQTILFSGLFWILFPIPWIFFADRILDRYFPSIFWWYILPLIIVSVIWLLLYKNDKLNTTKEKNINIIISIISIIVVGIITWFIFMMYALSNAPLWGV